MKKFAFIFFLCLVITPAFFANAATQENGAAPITAYDKPVDVYIFTQTGCPHCANAMAFLNNYKKTVNSNLTINEFDMVAHREYATKFFEFAAVYNAPTEAVPVAFVGDKFVAGDRLDNLKSLLDDCGTRACVNPEQFVADYIDKVATPPSQTGKTIVGYLIIGVLVVAVGWILIANLTKKN